MNKKLLLIVFANLIVLAALFYMVITREDKDDPLDTDYVMTIIDEKQLQKDQLDEVTQELTNAKEEIDRLAEQLDITQLLVDSTEQKYLVCEQQKSEFTGEPPPPRVKPSIEQLTLPELPNCDAELEQLAVATARYQELEAENTELNTRLASVSERINKLESEREELLAQVSSKEDYDILNEDNAAFKLQVNELQEEIQNLRQENSEVQMENSIAAQKNQDLMIQIEKLRNADQPKFDTSPLETKIDELEQEILILSAQRDEASQENKVLTAENTQLQSQLNVLNNKEEPVLDTTAFDEEIARLNRDLESLRKTNLDLKLKSDNSASKFDELDSVKIELSDKNSELSDENRELKMQISDLKDAQITTTNAENSELVERIVQLQQQVEMLRTKNNEIQQENQSVADRNETLLAQIKELENARPALVAQAIDPEEMKLAKAEIARLQTLLNAPIALDKHYLGARFCEKPQTDSLICVRDFLVRPNFTKSPVSSVAIRVFDEQGLVQAEGRFTPTSNQLYRLSFGAGKEIPAGNFKIEYYVDNQVLTGDPITLTQ